MNNHLLMASAINSSVKKPLTIERIERVRDKLQLAIPYQNGGDIAYVIADTIRGLDELLEIRDMNTADSKLQHIGSCTGNN